MARRHHLGRHPNVRGVCGEAQRHRRRYADGVKYGKPVAVSECGMTSKDVTLKSHQFTLFGSPEEQTSFVQTLLERATRDRYRFVINFATTDFESLYRKLPPAAGEIASIWMYTGLQDETGSLKPAGVVWDRYFKRTRKTLAGIRQALQRRLPTILSASDCTRFIAFSRSWRTFSSSSGLASLAK